MHRLSVPFILLCSLLLSATASGQSPARPNIVVILADDLGWGDVGFHGSDIRTPHIDRLAREGVVLDQFYTAPVCSPTRAGLMTGRYPNRFGLRQTVIPPWSHFGVDTAEVFLPEMLATAGYAQRAAIGKWHLGHARKMYLPLQRGFTHFYGFYNGALDYFTHKREGELDWHNDRAVSYDSGYTTDLISAEAVRCIRQYSKDEAPFFVYVAYNAPHGPLQAKKTDLLAYGFDPDQPVFGKGDTRGHGNTKRQTYSAMVSCMDQGIGRILKTLDELQLSDNTVVLFFSDNGAAPNGGGSHGSLRGWKFQEWNGGVRAPAIIRWPDGLKEPGKTRQVMGYIDVMPTLMAIAGVKNPPDSLDGRNMLAILQGHKKAIDRNFYLGYGALVHSPWKLIRAHAGNPRMKEKTDLLINIFKDPAERQDEKKKHPAVYRRLKKAVRPFDAIQPLHAVPPYGQGRKGFVAPKNWVIKQ